MKSDLPKDTQSYFFKLYSPALHQMQNIYEKGKKDS
jgi:hypothetical protein